MKLATLQLRHGVVVSHGYPPPLDRSFRLALSRLRVVSQKGAIHQLIHRAFSLLRDLMNPLTQPPQDNDLRFPAGLFLSGHEIDKLDGIQVDREKRIID